MEKGQNNMLRMWLLLVVVLMALLGMYYLPGQIGIWELRPVDLLAELRAPEDSLHEMDEPTTEATPISPIDTLKAGDSIRMQEAKELMARQAVRDSLYRTQSGATEDSTLVAFEDFQPERRALGHFYSAVARRAELGRPVRIAFLGDSFIEGDILTDALRSGLQRLWGGSGIGWMPLTSEVSKFRTSIRHDFGGWEDCSLLHSTKHHCPLTAHSYRAEPNAWVRYRSTGGSALGNAYIYYASQRDVAMRVELADTAYTRTLTATEGGEVTSLRLDVSPSASLRGSLAQPDPSFVSYGIALEQPVGIVVDNMSVRGNSGILLLSTHETLSKSFARVRPYDLIVLQYGLNVANEKQSDYTPYTTQMRKVIRRLRAFYPEADILLMSVSDRAQRTASGFETMHSIERLHTAQRRLAREEGIAFWSTLDAMRALGGITTMATRGWAAKDYTHMTHSGGKQLAEKLLQAFALEKAYYDTTTTR